jgi:hypothetical protein
LLADPLATIRNSESAPDHICSEVLDLLTIKWRRRAGARLFGDPESNTLRELFPPGLLFHGVGRDNLRRESRALRRRGVQISQADVDRIAIADGNVHLHTVLHCRVNGTSIDFFGMVRLGQNLRRMLDPDEADATGFSIETTPLPPYFVIEGDPLAGQVQSAVKAFRDWWKYHFHLGSGGGRPAIEVDYDLAVGVFRRLYTESSGFDSATRRELKPRRPSTKDILDRLKLHEVHIERTAFLARVTAWRAAGLAWPPVEWEIPDFPD